jgi:predicted secreted protein
VNPSRRGVAFVAHCLLNQNAKTDGGASCAGVYSPAVDLLRSRGWRIEQMPCPELTFTGLNRFWAVREQYDTPAHRRHCQRIAANVAAAMALHVERGEEVVVIGVEGSPSMGVCVTSSAPTYGGRPTWPAGAPELAEGQGIYMEELGRALAARGLPPPRMIGVTTPLPDHDPAAEQRALNEFLEG